MTWHIVCLAGPDDQYVPTTRPGDAVLVVPFDRAGDGAPQTSLADVLATHGVTPTPAAHDLLRAAIGAYAGDTRISRHDTFDGWTRDLMLHIPVTEPAGWEQASPRLVRLLRFLTGDRWRVMVRPAPTGYRPFPAKEVARPQTLSARTVCLFSGGLDSFVGAIDELAGGQQVVLVGHHAAGQGPTSVSQSSALTALRRGYSEAHSPFLQIGLSLPTGPYGVSETTTRGRSILFLALGVAVASGLGTDARLIIPENGFISLNVPLTTPRLGSFSTRTTHPHLIALLRALLNDVGIRVALHLPYRFATKGAMLLGCSDRPTLQRGLVATMSCAHPGAGRWVRGGSANRHCGYCVPCLIRRASIEAWGPDPTPYGRPNLRIPLTAERGADLRAMRLALARFAEREPRLGDVLKAGPLPGTPSELRAYLEVFRSGLEEVRRFVERHV